MSNDIKNLTRRLKPWGAREGKANGSAKYDRVKPIISDGSKGLTIASHAIPL